MRAGKLGVDKEVRGHLSRTAAPAGCRGSTMSGNKGEPYDRAYTKAWQKALKRAGIENFRWHDLRHTWASWIAQKGVPLSDIQEMGGWETQRWCSGTHISRPRIWPIGHSCWMAS